MGNKSTKSYCISVNGEFVTWSVSKVETKQLVKKYTGVVTVNLHCFTHIKSGMGYIHYHDVTDDFVKNNLKIISK
jgi:hypothetical protein